jgi:hypothetical protein
MYTLKTKVNPKFLLTSYKHHFNKNIMYDYYYYYYYKEIALFLGEALLKVLGYNVIWCWLIY